MDSPPPINEPPLLVAASSSERLVATWRQVLWAVLASVVIAPIAFAPAMIVVGLVLTLVKLEKADNVGLAVATLASLYLTYRYLRRGWSRASGKSTGALVGWTFAALFIGLCSHEVYFNVRKMQDAQRHKMVSINLRKLDEAERRLFAANPEHVVFTYGEVVGAGREVGELASIAGEDYRTLYPRHFGQTYCLRMPSGSSIGWEILDSTNPPGDWSNPRKYNLPGGGRLETTENNSRDPDGPVRFYRADGRLWVETQCVAGRLVGPVWVTGLDGRRTDMFPTNQRHD